MRGTALVSKRLRDMAGSGPFSGGSVNGERLHCLLGRAGSESFVRHPNRKALLIGETALSQACLFRFIANARRGSSSACAEGKK